MTRFWVSWWSGYYDDESCTKPPFQVWISGYRFVRADGRNECALCAVIDAPSKAVLWEAVNRYFPDAKRRFCRPVAADFQPGSRFPGFRGETAIGTDMPPERHQMTQESRNTPDA